MEFRTMIPARAIIPIMDVAVKNAPDHGMGRQDPDEGQGNGRHDDQGHREGLEPGHNQDIDEDQDGGEGDAQVPEDLPGDLPLSVPHQEGLLGQGRGPAPVPLHARRASSSGSPIWIMA